MLLLWPQGAFFAGQGPFHTQAPPSWTLQQMLGCHLHGASISGEAGLRAALVAGLRVAEDGDEDDHEGGVRHGPRALPVHPDPTRT